jgi:phage terminase large subunit GpA-like protein
MNSLAPSCPIERVVFMKAAQIGGTEVLLNFCGYLMHHAPAPALLIQPSVEMAKRFSRQRLDSLIENAPVLRELVQDRRSRDSGNTILLKEYRGGVLILTGANSAVGLRSLPAKYVLADELDGWPLDADGEGDPFSLAVKRAAAFGSRKILAVSTPTIEGFSRIETLYRESDQRRFFVPCPKCDHFQTLTWENVKWEPGKPETARYECEDCGTLIENHEKTGMLARGEWRPTAAGDGRTRGYHLSALYAPVGWPSWAHLARDFVAANRSRETLQTFVNTVLGETWRDEQAAPVEADALYSRREPYAAEVPLGVAALTVGCDTQDGRLECEIVGWGRDEESWSIGYHVLHGDPAQPEVWADLDRLLLRQWRHESGVMLPISAACIDSGGHHSEAVYQFCWPRMPRKIWGAKGICGFGRPVFPRRASKGFNRAPVFLVGVDAAKERVYSRLRVTEPGAGYCHFPLTHPRDYFEMLTSERIATRLRNGFPERIWVKPGGVRNEALDCRAYALAALHGLYMSGLKLNEHCDRLAAMISGKPNPAPAYQVYKSKFVSG